MPSTASRPIGDTRRKGKHHGTQAEVDEMAWMRQLLSWQREAADPGEFLDSLRFEMTSKEIFVFTPKGDVVNLPVGATPVDFAYAVHTEVGHRCIGARVNGKLVALERPLENGEVVEVFTSKDPNAGPSLDWQKFVVSGRAKSSIRQWFAKERREEALERGKELITCEVRRGGVPIVCPRTKPSPPWRGTRCRRHRAVHGDSEHHVPARGRRTAHRGTRWCRRGHRGLRTGRVIHRHPHRAAPAGAGVWSAGSRMSTPSSPAAVHRCRVTRCWASSHAGARSACTGQTARTPQISTVNPSASSKSVGTGPGRCSSWRSGRSTRQAPAAVGCHQSPGRRRSTSCRPRSRLRATTAWRSRFTFEMADPKHLGHVLNAVRRVEGVFDVSRMTSN